ARGSPPQILPRRHHPSRAVAGDLGLALIARHADQSHAVRGPLDRAAGVDTLGIDIEAVGGRARVIPRNDGPAGAVTADARAPLAPGRVAQRNSVGGPQRRAGPADALGVHFLVRATVVLPGHDRAVQPIAHEHR